MPGIGIGTGLPFGTAAIVRDPFIQYLNAVGITIDESNKGYSSSQIDYALSIFATCTNCTIDISGTNDHRTAASNDDLNTGLAAGNIYTLNDVLGAELHTSANAASDPNGNEANATTGWAAANNAVLTSVGSPVSVGSFAMSIESNTTPTSQANAREDFTVDNVSVYRISFDVRHNGVGNNWAFFVEGVNKKTIALADVTYEEFVYYLTTSDTNLTTTFQETSGANDGGVYFDNFSLKKVTFP